jgi:hypothetical protein
MVESAWGAVPGLLPVRFREAARRIRRAGSRQRASPRCLPFGMVGQVGWLALA